LALIILENKYDITSNVAPIAEFGNNPPDNNNATMTLAEWKAMTVNI